MIEEFNVN